MCDTTSTQQSSMPAWFEDIAKSTLGRADLESQRPMPDYNQARIAGFNPDEEAAFQSVRDAQGVGSGTLNGAITRASGAGDASALAAASPAINQAMGMSGLSAAAPYLGAGTASTANSAAGDLITGGAGISGLNAAAPLLGQATQRTSDLAGQYMNPYNDAVTSRLATLAGRNLSENLLPGVNDSFIRSGQFGSDRNKDFTARALRDTQESLLGQQAQTLQQGYGGALSAAAADQARLAGLAGTTGSLAGEDASRNITAGGALGQLMNSDASRNLQAASLSGQLTNQDADRIMTGAGLQGNLATSDANRQLSSAGALSQMANQQGSMAYRDADAQLRTGQQQQAQTQASLDQAYQDFMMKNGGWDKQNLSWLTGLMTGNKTGQTTTTTQPMSPWSTLGGGALAAYGLFKADGGRVHMADGGYPDDEEDDPETPLFNPTSFEEEGMPVTSDEDPDEEGGGGDEADPTSGGALSTVAAAPTGLAGKLDAGTQLLYKIAQGQTPEEVAARDTYAKLQKDLLSNPLTRTRSKLDDPLVRAGLGMMASPSRNPFQSFATGALGALKDQATQRTQDVTLDRQSRLEQLKIAQQQLSDLKSDRTARMTAAARLAALGKGPGDPVSVREMRTFGWDPLKEEDRAKYAEWKQTTHGSGLETTPAVIKSMQLMGLDPKNEDDRAQYQDFLQGGHGTVGGAEGRAFALANGALKTLIKDFKPNDPSTLFNLQIDLQDAYTDALKNKKPVGPILEGIKQKYGFTQPVAAPPTATPGVTPVRPAAAGAPTQVGDVLTLGAATPPNTAVVTPVPAQPSFTVRTDNSSTEQRQARDLIYNSMPVAQDLDFLIKTLEKEKDDNWFSSKVGIPGVLQRFSNDTLGQLIGENPEWGKGDTAFFAKLAGLKPNVQKMLKVDSNMSKDERADLEDITKLNGAFTSRDTAIARLKEMRSIIERRRQNAATRLGKPLPDADKEFGGQGSGMPEGARRIGTSAKNGREIWQLPDGSKVYK